MAIKKAIVTQTREIAREVFEVTLKYNSYNEPYPGQYLSLRVGSEWRSFTVIRDPSGGTIRMIVRLVPDTITKRFFDASVRPGAILEIRESQGSMIEVADNDCVFVATGTGIVPIVEIARHILESHRSHTTEIIFGARDRKSLFYIQELQELELKFPNCRVTVAVSRDYSLDFGYKGRVNEYIESHIDQMYCSDFYICGGSETIVSIMNLLSELGVSRDKLHQI